MTATASDVLAGSPTAPAGPRRELDRRVDAALADALPAPVELGLGVHRDRPVVVRRGPRPAGAPVAVPGPVGRRPRAAHRVQPGGRRGRLLPRTGVLAVVDAIAAARRATSRRRASPSRPSTPGPRSRCIATPATSRLARLPGWLYPRLAAQHAYLADRRRPAGTDLPVIDASLGVRARQLAGLGPRPRRDGHPAGLHPAVRRATISTMRRQPTGRRTRPTTPSSSWPRATAMRATTTRGCSRTSHSSSPVRSSTRSTCGRPTRSSRSRTIVGADPAPHREDAERIHEALLDELWDPETQPASARSTSSGSERSVEDTIVSFAPLLDPDLPTAQLDAIMTDLRSASFHPDRPDGYVVPSYDLRGEGFDERRYWRGPVWINTNWLLWNGLVQHGQTEEADAILAQQPRPRRAVGLPRVLRPVRRARASAPTASAGPRP